MTLVSLILPQTATHPVPTTRAESYCRALAEAGYEVEMLVSGVAAERAEELPEGISGRARRIEATEPGLAGAAFAGLREATGELLVVLDPTMGYSPWDVLRVAEAVRRGPADLAIASRFLPSDPQAPSAGRGWARGLLGRLAGLLTGASDPLSGLIALRRPVFWEALDGLRPLGTKFAFELLTRTNGLWVEVPCQAGWPAPRPELGLDDLRHLKRMADHRYGNASRLAQFCVVGASGMVVDLTCYALFQLIFDRTWLAARPVPFIGGPVSLAVAGALAIGIALTWNFWWNRRLTFSYARGGSILRQYFYYALSNFLGIALSFTLRLMLPSSFPFFHRHKLAAAVVGIVAATGISFSMSRWVVFSPRPASTPPDSAMAEPSPAP
jgi:dolichol-phosphate mannosyltransferase